MSSARRKAPPAASPKRGRGKPIDWKERRRKAALLLDELVNWETLRLEIAEGEDPRVIEEEFRRAVLDRLANQDKRRPLEEAIAAVAASQGISESAVSQFVYPRKRR